MVCAAKRTMLGALTLMMCLTLIPVASGHTGPDPIAHWYFTDKTVGDSVVTGRLGPDADLRGAPKLVSDRLGSAMRFDGSQDALVVEKRVEGASSKFITVAVWASIEQPAVDGTLVGLAEADGKAEKGWSLGYNDRVFKLMLATRDADDGDGHATTLLGTTEYQPGKLYHVVGTYDGATACLYVNGKLEATTADQHGDIYWPRHSSLSIGMDSDYDEPRFHRGMIRDVAIYNLAATDKWVAEEFDHNSELAELEAPTTDEPFGFVVRPYLQYATTESITVMCETTEPAKMTVLFGGLGESTRRVSEESDVLLHELKLDGLEPQAGHHYQVLVETADGKQLEAPLSTFQTASLPGTPYTFGVIGDTQGNPKVSQKLTDLLWAQRPNFMVIAGDLTETGTNKSHWTEHFFPGLQPIASRVPFYPVLGNHERNAKFYYQYMSLPDPEFYYSFKYGNAEFFMIDSNQRLDVESEQYKWLAKALAESEATWKFVTYHHPAFSSDEDDYGDLWKGEKSSWGEQRLRHLIDLYDEHQVDVVWNGHIHSYERTWPMKKQQVVERGGTVYVVTGGGGGGLETAGPIKPWFQNMVKHGHHYCLVSVNGRHMEFKAYDLEGRLFDVMTIDKSPSQP
ncbi:metallophosphoesterase [Aeoliella mucimassa]|uniref:Calcineurin-like phosphoesterase n=1 Tax=Aeoliella mucimassa TaxID=2527972 RepID=A0A518AW32_9BACT|nr:LamG-like jellyroll fold domain-containing protein [Aeoliella mucimassa]QDU58918.1 Calcineurin-like phosphoesterase [Aeoliella mucimassa]